MAGTADTANPTSVLDLAGSAKPTPVWVAADGDAREFSRRMDAGGQRGVVFRDVPAA